MHLKIFIDTEFTDFVDRHLISLGMAAETGEDFYKEVPYPTTACSEFVREVVVPLLEKTPPTQCEHAQLRDQILAWLDIVRGNKEIEICFDYQADWDLFINAMDYRVPKWCKSRNIAGNIDELLLSSFHKERGLPEHHALYDAQANRYAFQEPQNKTEPQS